MCYLIMFDLMSYTRRLFLLSIITIMIYQLIDVTINYRQYPTIIKSDLTYFQSGDLPSLTLCRNDHDWQFADKRKHNHYQSSQIEYAFVYNSQPQSKSNEMGKQYWLLSLLFRPEIFNFNEYYSTMADVIITNISSESLKCVTLLSKLQLNSSEQQIPAQIS